MDYGARLRKMRQAKKFSIYRLHEITGLSQGHISELEKGKNQPTIETLQRLLSPMGISLSEFPMRTMKSLISMNEKRSLWKHTELCLMSRQSFSSS